MILDMLEYYNMLKEKNISIIYSGPLWADDVEDVGLVLKKRLAYDALPLNASQSVFSVFVEQMNNMLMYSAEKEDFYTSHIPKGAFLLGTYDKTYFVQSGNVIKDDKIDLIKNRIDHLNTLDKAELRKFFKEQIKQADTNPESKGTGLGLIEIARRASSKIEYDIKPLEDGLSFFTMFVTIG